MAEALIAERERIIVERDAQLAAVNARLSSAEQLIAERERLIVERDGQLAALNVRIVALEQNATVLHGHLGEQKQELMKTAGEIEMLQREVSRRSGLRWWLSVPFHRMKKLFSGSDKAPPQDRR